MVDFFSKFSWQIAIFRSIPDPKFPSFCQCVATMSRSGGELIYNIFTLSILYFLPLAVIVFTYLSIVRKLYDRGRRHDEGMIALGKTIIGTCNSSMLCTYIHTSSEWKYVQNLYCKYVSTVFIDLVRDFLKHVKHVANFVYDYVKLLTPQYVYMYIHNMYSTYIHTYTYCVYLCICM